MTGYPDKQMIDRAGWKIYTMQNIFLNALHFFTVLCQDTSEGIIIFITWTLSCKVRKCCTVFKQITKTIKKCILLVCYPLAERG